MVPASVLSNHLPAKSETASSSHKNQSILLPTRDDSNLAHARVEAQVGDLVRLDGLMNATYNGCFGLVCSIVNARAAIELANSTILATEAEKKLIKLEFLEVWISHFKLQDNSSAWTWLTSDSGGWSLTDGRCREAKEWLRSNMLSKDDFMAPLYRGSWRNALSYCPFGRTWTDLQTSCERW